MTKSPNGKTRGTKLYSWGSLKNTSSARKIFSSIGMRELILETHGKEGPATTRGNKKNTTQWWNMGHGRYKYIKGRISYIQSGPLIWSETFLGQNLPLGSIWRPKSSNQSTIREKIKNAPSCLKAPASVLHPIFQASSVEFHPSDADNWSQKNPDKQSYNLLLHPYQNILYLIHYIYYSRYQLNRVTIATLNQFIRPTDWWWNISDITFEYAYKMTRLQREWYLYVLLHTWDAPLTMGITSVRFKTHMRCRAYNGITSICVG